MARKRRGSTKKLIDYLARFVILLGFLAYTPIVAWWQSIPPMNRTILLVTVTFVIVTNAGAVIVFAIARKQERARTWRRAMAGWQNSMQGNIVTQKQSAIYLSDMELEKLAAQVYQKMGYRVRHVGQMGDHGVDVMLVSPDNQKEIVQCKQWSKPVGEPVLRDLYGAMIHEGAMRGWVWAPRGFSRPARAWVQGKSIVLVDDAEIDRLIGIAYRNK